MDSTQKYFEHLNRKFREVADTQLPNIRAAAELIARRCAAGGKLYLFGTGHSHMIAEELYLRAGGLAIVHAILPPELMLHEMPNKSTLLERMEGYAASMLSLYRVEPGDALVVISNSGRNAVPVEMCLEAKKLGAAVIALTSLRHSTGCASRHSSGLKMYQIADVTIDNCADPGDASFPVEGVPVPMGPTSDATGVAIAQALACQVAENMVRLGVQPPVFRSSNADGGDEYNKELFSRYYGYWK